MRIRQHLWSLLLRQRNQKDYPLRLAPMSAGLLPGRSHIAALVRSGGERLRPQRDGGAQPDQRRLEYRNQLDASDAGCANENTAEGRDALFSLTTGFVSTASMKS